MENSPIEPQNSPEMNTLTFQDLVILKQFIEKGMRSAVFMDQEKNALKILHKKIDNILLHAIELEKFKNKETT